MYSFPFAFYHIVCSRKCSWKNSLNFARSKFFLLTKKMMKMQWKARANRSKRERVGKFWERFFLKHDWIWNKARSVTIAPFKRQCHKSSYYVAFQSFHYDFVACHLSWMKFIQSPVKMDLWQWLTIKKTRTLLSLLECS